MYDRVDRETEPYVSARDALDLIIEAGAYSRTPELFREDVLEVLFRMVDG